MKKKLKIIVLFMLSVFIGIVICGTTPISSLWYTHDIYYIEGYEKGHKLGWNRAIDTTMKILNNRHFDDTSTCINITFDDTISFTLYKK